MDVLQRTGATPGCVRPTCSSAMTPVYSCPVHGSCTSAKSSSGVRGYDITPGCSLYATPPYNGPRRAGVACRRGGCRRGDRCRARYLASSSPFTGSSGCLAAARRQADSVDAILPSVTTLDVVAGPELADTNTALRPPIGYVDVEKPSTDAVFYTGNSQHPQACGHVSDLLFSTSWGREHYASSTPFDVPANDHQTADPCSGQRSTVSDATSVGNDRGQSTLLVDFHC